MAKGYCVHSDVAALLGLTFTTAQEAACDALIAAAEAYIDRGTHRAWLVGPITGERYNLKSPTLYLKSRPVTSVQSVQTRTQAVGDTLYTAIAGVDYELFDANLGQINFSGGYSGPRAVALVSYTPNLGTVPADIAHAAALIVANTMTPMLVPDSYGIAEMRFGRETGLKFDDNGITITIPQTAQQIIDGYRIPIIS